MSCADRIWALTVWDAGTGAKATSLRGASIATRPAVCEQVCASTLPPFPPQFSFVVVLLWEMQSCGVAAGESKGVMGE